MNGPPEPGNSPHRYPLGRRRTRIQWKLRDHLKRIPGIEDVRYAESGTGVEYQIVASVNTSTFANGTIPSDEAHLQANWWPQPDEDWFQIHFWDTTGFDCGWHRQANDHVDGLDHVQYRERPDDEYDYEPVTFESDNPVGILWEIVDERLVDRITERYA